VADPVVYVSSWRIAEGKFDAYRRFHDELAKVVEENEPEVVAFLAFANADGTEITGVHVFPDGSALDSHMRVLAERMGLVTDDVSAVMSMLEPAQIQVYGTPPDSARAMDRSLEGQGVPFVSKPRFVGGFVRRPRQ
jgi:hypothetical protein